MTKIVFKNLDSSALARQIVLDKVDDLVAKFPDLENHQIKVTLSMNNSSSQAGPDEFRVKYYISGKKFADVLLEKKARTLYKAVADANEAALELLNRTLDRIRVKSKNASLKFKQDNFAQVEPGAV